VPITARHAQLHIRRFLTSGMLHLWPFKLKIGTPVTHAEWNVCTSFGFPKPFCIQVRSPYPTDGRTDGRTGKTLIAAYQDGRTTTVIFTFTVQRTNSNSEKNDYQSPFRLYRGQDVQTHCPCCPWTGLERSTSSTCYTRSQAGLHFTSYQHRHHVNVNVNVNQIFI